MSLTLTFLWPPLVPIDRCSQSTQDVSDTLHKIFLVLPHYAIADGIYSIEQNYKNQELCAGKEHFCAADPRVPGSSDLPYEVDYGAMDFPGVGMHLTYLLAVGIIEYVLSCAALVPLSAADTSASPAHPHARPPSQPASRVLIYTCAVQRLRRWLVIVFAMEYYSRAGCG